MSTAYVRGLKVFTECGRGSTGDLAGLKDAAIYVTLDAYYSMDNTFREECRIRNLMIVVTDNL